MLILFETTIKVNCDVNYCQFKDIFCQGEKMRQAHWLPQQNKKLEIITRDEMYKHL